MDRAALVTAGTGSLGKAIAIALVERGYRVALVDGGDAITAHAFTDATSIPVFAWNSADFDACRNGIATVERAIGPIDILVNYVGAGHDAQWEQAINASLGAMLNMSRSVIDGMRLRRFGRIVNIGPVSALPGTLGQRDHQAARADILALTRSLALTAAGKQVTVNAIAAGHGTQPSLTPGPSASTEERQAVLAGIAMARAGTPQDISRTVLFLVDDEAGFITGTVIDVDGGQYLLAPTATTSQSVPLPEQGAGVPAAQAEAALDWSPQMALGVAEIDAAHRAFILQLAQVHSAPDAAFENALYALITAMETDFREEEALMEAIDFPGLRSHREQHARVLSALHHVVPQVMQGDHAQARKAVELIAPWFMLHLTTMDATLAVALELAAIPAAAPQVAGN